MKATISILPRAEAMLEEVPLRDLRLIVQTLELLAEFPLMAQTAGIEEAPDVRRAVAGMYLIYYRYDPQQQVVQIYNIRHGRQKPITAEEIDR